MLRVVVMGVAGSGKTTVGRALAECCNAELVDADTAHPAANIEKMARGEPLDDFDRAPWLRTLTAHLSEADRVVVTCSALKRAYRDVLRSAGGVRFVHLSITPELAIERTSSRQGHFMKPGMVTSQFATLEPPAADELDIIVVDAAGDVDTVLAEICRQSTWADDGGRDGG